MTLTIYKKIPPLNTIDGYKDVLIEECNESLVHLVENAKLRIAYTYFQNSFEYAEKNCYIRCSVANMLSVAANNLPNGIVLVVNDGWRPFKVQLEIYNRMLESIKQIHPNFSEIQLHEETAKFASEGSLNTKMPSPHFTGGSVDVTLANDSGFELNMGSQFDSCNNESGTRFFEEKSEKGIELPITDIEALYNRRILFHCMIGAGFTNYSNEWWHFDYGNQLWAKIKNTSAIYGLTKPLSFQGENIL
ncbi:MAG: M15 family metallopeptidase [Mariniphaga sp.]